MPSLDYFDEIWCPSNFVRESIALKAPYPVLSMPHAIGFERPKEDTRPPFGRASGFPRTVSSSSASST